MTVQKKRKVLKYAVSPLTIALKLDNGEARISGISPSCIRVRLSPKGKLAKDDHSYSIENPLASIGLKVKEGSEVLTASLPGLVLEIGLKKFSVSLKDSRGEILSSGLPFEFDGDKTKDTRLMRDGEDVFGLGERVTPLGRRGYMVENWNTDEPRHHSEMQTAMYVSIPFMISSRKDDSMKWGMFLDNPRRSTFDIGNTSWEKLQIELCKGEYNAYFFTGNTIEEIVSEYTSLTGRHSMPPVWATGYHQCRWSYMDALEAEQTARSFREKKIPCDALWFDINYMDDFRVFTFDKKQFAKPAKLMDTLHELGFHNVVIVDPGVKTDKKGMYPVVDEGTKKGYFIKRPDGKDYKGRVWPGWTKFPDFSNPEVRAWWGRLHAFYDNIGIDGYWNDMNEPVDFSTTIKTVPLNVRLADEGRKSTMEKMHNVYGLFEAKATVEGMAKLKPDVRPFLLTRAGYSGIQKYAAKWCGDNCPTWAHLKASIAQIINMGLSGIGFVGVDVGGFGGNANPELLSRWTQLGAFYPFFRNHSAIGTNRHEPWAFGQKTEEICRDAIQLRYHLLPYFYQLFYELHSKGQPVLRPMFWQFASEPKSWECQDQFMLGNTIMAAPVVERGATERSVWFPKGMWVDYFSGEKIEGGSTRMIEAPLEKIPVYVKAGAVIPVMDPVESTVWMDKKTLGLEIVPGENVKEELYEDDMETTAYLKGAFFKSPISLGKDGVEVELAEGSRYKSVTLRILKSMIQEKNLEGFQSSGIWLEKTFKDSRKISVWF